MTELFILCAFVAGLLLCLFFDVSILYALLFGYLLFFSYGLLKKHRPRALLSMSLQGVRTIRRMLLIFLLIGMITAVWRACGTIAYLIYHTAGALVPSLLLLMIFLLCCLLSFLTGTSFGTAATVGVISMTIAGAAGVSPAVAGGAVLSGIFFGDRWSPMSTSAVLVSTVTGTDLYRNLRAMAKTAAVPFAVTCLLYLVLGLSHPAGGASPALLSLFPQSFQFRIWLLLPAALVLVLALLRVRVTVILSASIAAACVLCLTLQHMPPVTLLKTLLLGFQSENPALAPMMDGGGMISMARVVVIICLSSCYSGLFAGTGLLRGLKTGIHALSARITPYGALVCTAAATNMAACNQTLSIMLTGELCGDLWADREALAVGLEDTAVVIAPLIPWSIAEATPLSTVGAPTKSILFAFYLFLLPLWGLLRALLARKPRPAGTAQKP